jgi:glutamate-1-semialdehyde 2,1-aminomutase
VAGHVQIMNLLDHVECEAIGREKVLHPGTFNANPISAAAGVATLNLIQELGACSTANARGEELRRRLNEMFQSESVPWAVYGTFSMFHLYMNSSGHTIRAGDFDPMSVPYNELTARPPELLRKFRLAMLVNGVDLNLLGGGLLSAAHGDEDFEWTIRAFREALKMLKDEGEL